MSQGEIASELQDNYAAIQHKDLRSFSAKQIRAIGFVFGCIDKQLGEIHGHEGVVTLLYKNMSKSMRVCEEAVTQLLRQYYGEALEEQISAGDEDVQQLAHWLRTRI